METTCTQTSTKQEETEPTSNGHPDDLDSKTNASKSLKPSLKKKKASKIDNLQDQFTDTMDQELKKVKNPTVLVTSLIKLLTKYASKLPQYTEDVQKTALEHQPKVEKREFTQHEIVLPSRKTRWVRNISKQEQKQKYEEQKFIAYAFCQHGINFHYVTQKYPDMNPKSYRCTVEAVNNQAVNDIVNFLRYECNVQVQRLNRDQKRSIRTQLTKIREWMGNRDPQQLETFYKFVYRYYDKSVEIKFEDALKLYKTIIQIIKSPFVNVLQAEEGVNVGETNDELTTEEEKAMIILFIKHKDFNKVSDDLGQKYGYDIRWSFHSVRVKLRQFLQKSIDRLIQNISDVDIQSVFSKYFTRKRRELLQESNEMELKIKLYSFYLEKKPTSLKVVDLINNLRQFFQLYGGQASDASLPKLQQSQVSAFSLQKSMSNAFDLQMTKAKLEDVTADEEEDSQQEVKLEN